MCKTWIAQFLMRRQSKKTSGANLIDSFLLRLIDFLKKYVCLKTYVNVDIQYNVNVIVHSVINMIGRNLSNTAEFELIKIEKSNMTPIHFLWMIINVENDHSTANYERLR